MNDWLKFEDKKLEKRLANSGVNLVGERTLPCLWQVVYRKRCIAETFLHIHCQGNYAIEGYDEERAVYVHSVDHVYKTELEAYAAALRRFKPFTYLRHAVNLKFDLARNNEQQEDRRAILAMID
jgi:hypothetical protein